MPHLLFRECVAVDCACASIFQAADAPLKPFCRGVFEGRRVVPAAAPEKITKEEGGGVRDCSSGEIVPNRIRCGWQTDSETLSVSPSTVCSECASSSSGGGKWGRRDFSITKT